MKINPGRLSRKDSLKSDKKDKQKSSSSVGGLFRNLFSTETKVFEQSENSTFQAEAFIEEIDELSKELKSRKSLGSFERYRAKIRELLEEFSKSHENATVDGLGMQDGKHKRLHLVKEINEHLIQLTHRIMGDQKSSEFLKQSPVTEKERYESIPTLVDSIKGLLIDFLR
ncbi:DUF327 family protein [bacterium]|jgi:uncharacterized protein YaaR (DUF327 family)|nr:DUF327 family protein [bacterium]